MGFLSTVLLVVAAHGTVRARACAAAPDAPALDHAILAVRDLDRAAASFTSHGFRLKQGRLHANGLLNQHVKFRDGTSIELMTVRGSAGDALAADYAALLAAGDGGVFVGLTLPTLDRARQAATRVGLTPQRRASGQAAFLSFPRTSPAAAVFFGTPGPPIHDPDSLTTHAFGAGALEEAWVEGDATLGELLATLGAVPCDTVRSPEGQRGQRWMLARGALVIVPTGRTASRPRVLGVVLRTTGAAGADTVVRPHPGFWVRMLAHRR